MAHFNSLYEKYTSTQPSGAEIDAKTILAPYTQQFGITITDSAIILEHGQSPLNNIPRANIYAIVDEEEELYIILRSSIYVLNKVDGKIKLNIRNL